MVSYTVMQIQTKSKESETVSEWSLYTANVLSAESTDECMRTKSKDN